MKVAPKARCVHTSRYLRFYCYHWVDNFAGGLLIPEVIITQKSVPGHWYGSLNLFKFEIYISETTYFFFTTKANLAEA